MFFQTSYNKPAFLFCDHKPRIGQCGEVKEHTCNQNDAIKIPICRVQGYLSKKSFAGNFFNTNNNFYKFKIVPKFLFKLNKLRKKPAPEFEKSNLQIVPCKKSQCLYVILQ